MSTPTAMTRLQVEHLVEELMKPAMERHVQMALARIQEALIQLAATRDAQRAELAQLLAELRQAAARFLVEDNERRRMQ